MNRSKQDWPKDDAALNSDSVSAPSSESDQEIESGTSSCDIMTDADDLYLDKELYTKDERCTKGYKRAMMQAYEVIQRTKSNHHMYVFNCKDFVRGCYRKAADYYTRSLELSRNAWDRARCCIQLTYVHMHQVARAYDKEGKIRTIQKCLMYLAQCMQHTKDFDSKIRRELEEQLRSVLIR